MSGIPCANSFFSFFLILLFPIYAHITPVFCLLLLMASNSENFCWNTYYFLELFSSKVQFVDWENNSWLSNYCTSIIQAKWRPLQTLTLSMQIRYMDMLLDGGLDIDSVDKVCRYLYFVSSMIYSSFLSLSLSLVHFFSPLEQWILVGMLQQDGLTALHKAIIGKKEAVISHLLRKGANPHVKDGVSRRFWSQNSIQLPHRLVLNKNYGFI